MWSQELQPCHGVLKQKYSSSLQVYIQAFHINQTELNLPVENYFVILTKHNNSKKQNKLYFDFCFRYLVKCIYCFIQVTVLYDFAKSPQLRYYVRCMQSSWYFLVEMPLYLFYRTDCERIFWFGHLLIFKIDHIDRGKSFLHSSQSSEW